MYSQTFQSILNGGRRLNIALKISLKLPHEQEKIQVPVSNNQTQSCELIVSAEFLSPLPEPKTLRIILCLYIYQVHLTALVIVDDVIVGAATSPISVTSFQL